MEIDGSPSLRKSFYLLNGSNKFLSFLKELKVNKVIPQTPAHVNGRPSLSNPLSPPRACQYLSWETLTQQAVKDRHLSFFRGSIFMKQFTDAKELCGDILIAAFSLLCKHNERYLLKRWTDHPTPNIEEKLVHNSQQARGGDKLSPQDDWWPLVTIQSEAAFPRFC